MLIFNIITVWHRGWLYRFAINLMKPTFLFVALIITTTFSYADPSFGSLTLTNFRGVFTDQQVVDLNWVTMMESGVDHFEIQRSGDGLNFQDIDSIDSKMKISTSDYQLHYSYTDIHPLTGTSYYRIMVIGKNGSITQTPVVHIINNLFEGTRIYPTLIQNNMVFVESDKNLRSAKMEFFDLSGNKISETNWSVLAGRQNVQVSRSGVPTGTYVIRLTANGQFVKNQLVMVQNH
jgi:hypothetical protein